MITFRVLGELQIEGPAGRLDPGTGDQRGLLTILLRNAGRIVLTDVLADELWQGAPPDDAHATLHGHVTTLRHALEPDARGRRGRVLCSRAAGYMIDLDHADVDHLHFAADAHAGHEAAAADHPAEASAHFDAALARWRGPALADVTDVPCARDWARQLDEARLEALEGWAAAELEQGHAGRVIARLEPRLRDDPQREPLHAQAMLAFHRAGRPGDALRLHQDLRRARAEVGLALSPEVQAIEAQILADLADLDAPPPGPPAQPPDEGGPGVPDWWPAS